MMHELWDGVDELFLKTAPVRDLFALVGKEADAITALAIITTAISLIVILLHLFTTLRSVGDVRGFMRYLVDRIRLSSYTHPWGTIRDARTGYPVPFARITLVAADGRIVAVSVADIAGRYGFGVPFSRVAGADVSLEVRKGSYYDYRHRGPLPMSTRTLVGQSGDRYLDPTASAASEFPIASGFTASLALGAFWASVVVVPMAAAEATGPIVGVLVSGLAVSILGRLCGLAMGHYPPVVHKQATQGNFE